MRRERAGELDPSQPSLLVTYGNTTRKVRPLDRELLVLGRAPICDVSLSSPEVASIHALIVRGDSGWRIRDCGSRLGTRLNGRVVQETALEDGDVLQIGSFSFHLNLPGNSAQGTGRRPGSSPGRESLLGSDGEKVQKLERSRRRLVRLALSYRRRWHQLRDRAAGVQTAPALLDEQCAELARLHETLRDQQQAMETRAGQLNQLEEQLNARFAALEHELSDFQERHERAAAENARLQSEADDRLRKIQDRERSIKEAEAGFALAAAELEALRGQMQADSRAGEETERLRDLERRGHELDYFARYLRRMQQQIEERRRDLALAADYPLARPNGTAAGG